MYNNDLSTRYTDISLMSSETCSSTYSQVLIKLPGILIHVSVLIILIIGLRTSDAGVRPIYMYYAGR